MNSIEAYIQFEDGLISEDGSVSDRSTEGVPPELHVRVPQFHRARLYRIAAQYLEVFGDGGIEHTARFLRLHPDRTVLRPMPLRRGSS